MLTAKEAREKTLENTPQRPFFEVLNDLERTITVMDALSGMTRTKRTLRALKRSSGNRLTDSSEQQTRSGGFIFLLAHSPLS